MRIQSLGIKFLLSHRTKVRETIYFVNFYYQKSAFLKSILSCKKLLTASVKKNQSRFSSKIDIPENIEKRRFCPI